MMPRPPLPPRPERWMFASAESYMRALSQHEAEVRRRHEDSKTEMALLIVVALIVALMGVFMLGFVLHLSFGWRGPVGGVLAAGLFWVAVMQVRRRL